GFPLLPLARPRRKQIPHAAAEVGNAENGVGSEREKHEHADPLDKRHRPAPPSAVACTLGGSAPASGTSSTRVVRRSSHTSAADKARYSTMKPINVASTSWDSVTASAVYM